MGTYSIKDLEKLSGIKAHTIRIWEQRYKLIEPKRTETNIRFYDDEQLKYLLNVCLLSKSGFKVSQISKWTESELHAHVSKIYESSLLHDTKLSLDLNANDMMTAMIDMDSQKFNRIYDNSIRNSGFEKTIVELIYPFLEKVGILWSIDQINPAHEHFISCLIRQKIISAIDRLEETKGGKRFMLFLPEGEHHELGLLLGHFMLKKKGACVYYLGQDLPSSNIETAILTVAPDYVMTFMIDPAIVNTGSQVVNSIYRCCKNTTLLVVMRRNEEMLAQKPEEVHFLHSMEDLEQFL